MTFDITPTAAQHDLARRAHEFAEQVVRPVASDYDQRQEFPWPELEEAARQGFYSGDAFPLADLATAIDAARLLTWRASWMAASGVPFERGEGSMSKLAASEVAVRTTERAIQTMGGWGSIKDHPVAKWYRDAKLYTIFEGTSESQRIVISNALGAADDKPPCTSASSRPAAR